jgi:hypothetical protein
MQGHAAADPEQHRTTPGLRANHGSKPKSVE